MKTKATILLALVLLISTNGFTQDLVKEKKFGFELNGGVSIALTEPTNTHFLPGFGFEGVFHYSFNKNFGVYAGWGYNDLFADLSFLGADKDFEETGYIVGIQYTHPLESTNIKPFLRTGILYNHIEIEDNSGTIIKDSGHGVGFQIATGIDIPLRSNWHLIPGLKFNSLSREIAIESAKQTIEYQYIQLRFGIMKKF